MTISPRDVQHRSSSRGASGIPLAATELARIAAVLNRSSTHLHDDPAIADASHGQAPTPTAEEVRPRPDARLAQPTGERLDVEREWRP